MSGRIARGDLGILATYYGYGAIGPQLSLAAAECEVGLEVIPEPATLALVALGLPMMRRRA